MKNVPGDLEEKSQSNKSSCSENLSSLNQVESDVESCQPHLIFVYDLILFFQFMTKRNLNFENKLSQNLGRESVSSCCYQQKLKEERKLKYQDNISESGSAVPTGTPEIR
ncbi:hypothetical protein AMECASPLE_026970 [Ameca splendens]|uniref:Uncharacterized protein n=1 Tax=Ameca splendens TaxID=208324 RepID=A0ABV0ZPX4_9TELE